VSSSSPPDALPSPPRRPRRREPPSRRTALTAEAIVTAAIELLDEGGMEGLSMRRVAERVGTGAASLYAHVSGREELLQLVFDRLVGQVPLPMPDPDRWHEQLFEMLDALRRVLTRHRDAAMSGLGIPTTPNVLAAAEVLASLMRTGGMTDRVVALGMDQLSLLTVATALEDGLIEHSGMTPEEIQRYYDDAEVFYARLPADRFPAIASIAAAMTGPDGDERFRFGFDAMIAGFEALSDAERRAGGPPPEPPRPSR
jgi:AcrR family transcriptional regulator